MNRFVVLLGVVLCGLSTGAFSQSLDDEYVQVFKLIQEADTLSSTAPSQALAKYLDAQTALDRLHKGSPEWNARIVNYRLSYLANRIRALSESNSPPTTKTNTTALAATPENSAQADPDRLKALQDQVRQLQSQNGLLESKLKEALALRPAAVEPTQLAKAEDRISALQKENEELKARVQNQQQALIAPSDTKSLEAAQKSLKETERQLADQTSRLSKVTLEKEALESRLKNATLEANGNAAVVSENQHLKQQLASAQAASAAAAKLPETSRQLAEAQTQISKLQADKESLRLEKVALESRIKQLSAKDSNTATAVPAADNAKIKQLESQRDDLQKRLDAALKEGSGRKSKSNSGRVQDLESQLAAARTRLEIFEARAAPYSAEELQLLQSPAPTLAATNLKSSKKSLSELPAGSKDLVAEAQHYFAAKDYDKAEAAYLQVLKQDPKNVPTLGNLAAIEIESQHFDKAEANVKQALAQDPEDPYSLYVLGILRFRQGKYDEALDALSHSAKLDPQNAEVQNYLGLALSEKGQRAPAEAALRKAVQLQPGYSAAHYNLAVVYATQQPPATELARWHYQKAIGAGHPRNAELEKRFERKQQKTDDLH
jgi:cytochrome c-type biogenesis protein CcmH/NrfG